jgi:uncharacterized membrane protein
MKNGGMKFLPLLIASNGTDVGGFFGGIFGLFILVLSIFWLILPFIVISKFNELLKVQRHATVQIQDVASKVATLNRSALERMKALQWMLDNWPADKTPGLPPGSPKVYRID